MFTKEERSTFPYWFAHWCAFNMTALNLRCWKFKYLFHDIEKPWLMLFWKDYSRVQKFHRKHSSHHLTFDDGKMYDFEAMIIDWECSRYTKSAVSFNAKQEYEDLCNRHPEIELWVKHCIESTLLRLGL